MSAYVGLNVGGKIYRTSRLTLTRYPDSFFSSLLDGDIPSDKDDQGNYLIDQDGEIFRHVLNFLRYGQLELPEGFNELGLLKRQADFLSLEPLEVLIEKYSLRSDVPIGGSIGLMFDDGKLFNMTKETLSKEEDSFFTKMLKGEVPVLRDSQGNFIMGRDGSVFHHIRNYLRDGGIFNPVTSDELKRLQKEAKYFGLDVLGYHVRSIDSLRSTPCSIHVYWCPSSPSVAYGQELFNIIKSNNIHDIIHSHERITHSGVLDMDKINPDGPTGIQDVENYLRKVIASKYLYSLNPLKEVGFNHVRVNSDWTRLEVKYFFST